MCRLSVGFVSSLGQKYSLPFACFIGYFNRFMNFLVVG